MGKLKKLYPPKPEPLSEILPLSPKLQAQIDGYRKTIGNLISGKDRRLALVFGPCSIHDIPMALEYGQKFRILAKEVEKTCFCVMRVYVEKPRSYTGWKGLLYDPYLDGSNAIEVGIQWTRELFLKLSEWEIPIATEVLNPLVVPFFSDLVSWGFIGARTSGSQPHRELAAALPFPMGFKNSPDGNVLQAIQAAIVAQKPHRFPHLGSDGQMVVVDALGNPWTHIVLRGSSSHPNYDAATIAEVIKMQETRAIDHRILIDCSHGNCQKQVALKKVCFRSVLEQFSNGNQKILGMMFESHLKEGSQRLPTNPLQYGVSVTDPCLGWDDTESLVLNVTKRTHNWCFHSV